MKRFLVVIPVFLFIMLGACGVPLDGLDPRLGTLVAQSQTANKWTPTPVTPSPTTKPKEAVIVNMLNSALRGADPLEETLDAKFSVTDIGFETSGKPAITTTLRIHVECEWVFKPSCSVERAFVVLAHVFEREGIRKKIMEQMPETIEYVQVRAYERMTHIGIIEIRWQDLLAFSKGDITGDQLAARTVRFP